MAGLLITDEGAGAPRATYDVDAIAEIASYAEYDLFGDRLRTLGFSEDSSEGAPLCRWVNMPTVLDLMPLDAQILGFSSRWYGAALESAVPIKLADDLGIRVAPAPYFLATKLEAFLGRGGHDYMDSHDLEDLVMVVDGRASIVGEIESESGLRAWVGREIRILLADQRFIDALPGYLLPDAASQARLGLVLERFRTLASI